MGRPLWTPPPGKLDKSVLPVPPPPTTTTTTTMPTTATNATTAAPTTTAGTATATLASGSHVYTWNLTRSTPSTWAPDYSPSSSSSSSPSSSGSIPLRHSRLTDEDQQRRARVSATSENMVMRGDSSMLTLDEFLRETSAASATRDEAERHLNNLLTLRREMAAERSVAEGSRSRLLHGRERRRDWVSPPNTDSPDGSTSWRTLVEHTPAGRARILGALPSGTGSPVATPSRPVPVPYTYTPLPAAGQDNFDTLVGQIRRIGALQDFMLSGIVEGESVPAATAASSNETVTEENNGTGGARIGGGVVARVENGVVTGGEEAERNAVAALRVREARLRAMQTRIDLLASEFALLRNSRRELRWVEAEALSTLQAASARNTAALNTTYISTLPPTSTPSTSTPSTSTIPPITSTTYALSPALNSATTRAAIRSTAAIERYVSAARRTTTASERTQQQAAHAARVAASARMPLGYAGPAGGEVQALREMRTGLLQQAEWGRQGSGRREGDSVGSQGTPRRGGWTTGERDRLLRREVLRMSIERLPVGGV